MSTTYETIRKTTVTRRDTPDSGPRIKHRIESMDVDQASSYIDGYVPRPLADLLILLVNQNPPRPSRRGRRPKLTLVE